VPDDPEVPEEPLVPLEPEVPEVPAAPVGPIGPPVTFPVMFKVVFETWNGSILPNPSVTLDSEPVKPACPIFNTPP
jgi:hypothetical protein